MKNTESLDACSAGSLFGTSREASSATSPRTRLYRASLGVRSATSPRVSTSPVSQASLRRWMSLATKRSRPMNTTMVPQVKASVAHRDMRQAALRTTGLPVLKDIAHSPKRSNERREAAAVYLAAKPIDVNVDDVRVRLDAHSPYFIEDH